MAGARLTKPVDGRAGGQEGGWGKKAGPGNGSRRCEKKAGERNKDGREKGRREGRKGRGEKGKPTGGGQRDCSEARSGEGPELKQGGEKRGRAHRGEMARMRGRPGWEGASRANTPGVYTGGSREKGGKKTGGKRKSAEDL